MAARKATVQVSTARGFSLIEVMIVIALVALISAVTIPSLTGVFRTSTESFARRLSLQLREARDRAMLQDKLLRLRVNLDSQEYWLEEAPSNYLLPKNGAARGDSALEKEEAEKKETAAFRQVTEITGDKQKVPKGLKIVEIISPRRKEPFREGTADVYFYNNGSTDGATLHFETDEKVRQAVQLHPVTGQSKLIAGWEEGKR